LMLPLFPLQAHTQGKAQGKDSFVEHTISYRSRQIDRRLGPAFYQFCSLKIPGAARTLRPPGAHRSRSVET
jgi:hypothetical protein